jgi:hypothetical protein
VGYLMYRLLKIKPSTFNLFKEAENTRELAKVWGLKNYNEEVIVDILRLCI